MTSAKKFRYHLIGLTPLYAAVGATELAADKLRELGSEEARPTPAAEPAVPAAAPGPARPAPAPGSFRDLARLVRGARRAPGYAIDQAVGQVTRTQEAYDDLVGRGQRLAHRVDAVRPVPTPTGFLRQANAEVTRRRREAEESARAALAATRSAASTTFGVARAEGEAVVEAVAPAGANERRRTLRDAATDLEQGELRTTAARPRRRTSAAARTAAPSPTRPVVGAEPVVGRTPVLAGSGMEAGSTVTPATGGPATPRLAGTAARRTRVADAAAAAGGAPRPVRVRRRPVADAAAGAGGPASAEGTGAGAATTQPPAPAQQAAEPGPSHD